MAWYSKATRKNIPPGPNDPPIKARVVILHVADTEATSLFDYFNGPSGGVESHFYIRYDGSVEQYRDTAYQADANMMANDFAISIETQGLAGGTWTAAQLATIKALLTWCHQTHGIPLVVCPKWDGAGIGYHILFEAQWDQRNASCPGPNRIDQFKTVLVPWMATGGNEEDMPLNDDDLAKVARSVWGYKNNDTSDAYEYLRNGIAADTRDAILSADVIPAPVKQDGNPNWTVGASLEWTGKGVVALQATVAALQSAVTALAEAKGADADAITKAVVDKIAALTINLDPQES